MLEEKINEETAPNSGEEVEEEKVQLKPEDLANVKKAIKQAHVDASKLDPKSQEIFNRMLEEAKLPVRIEDKDFQMGEQEVDVRHLSRANWRQMEFRQNTLDNIYLKQINMSLVDILRMLMVIADKLGVTDIVGATDEVIEKVEAKEKEKAQKSN